MTVPSIETAIGVMKIALSFPFLTAATTALTRVKIAMDKSVSIQSYTNVASIVRLFKQPTVAMASGRTRMTMGGLKSATAMTAPSTGIVIFAATIARWPPFLSATTTMSATVRNVIVPDKDVSRAETLNNQDTAAARGSARPVIRWMDGPLKTSIRRRPTLVKKRVRPNAILTPESGPSILPMNLEMLVRRTSASAHYQGRRLVWKGKPFTVTPIPVN